MISINSDKDKWMMRGPPLPCPSEEHKTNHIILKEEL